MHKCVQCHDLRTVLARPRTPDAWRRAVGRMAVAVVDDSTAVHEAALLPFAALALFGVVGGIRRVSRQA